MKPHHIRGTSLQLASGDDESTTTASRAARLAGFPIPAAPFALLGCLHARGSRLGSGASTLEFRRPRPLECLPAGAPDEPSTLTDEMNAALRRRRRRVSPACASTSVATGATTHHHQPIKPRACQRGLGRPPPSFEWFDLCSCMRISPCRVASVMLSTGLFTGISNYINGP